MGTFAENWEKKQLDEATGKSPEAARFVALCTTAPTKAAAGTAATFTGYKRVKTTAASWNSAVGGEPSKATTAAAVAFAECTAGESKVGWFEVWTAETGGERVCWGALKVEKTITAGDTVEFAAGELEVTQK